MSQQNTIRYGLVGLGGYAGEICDRLLSDAAPPRGRLVAVFVPEPDRYASRIADLLERGIRVTNSYEHLLSEDIEIVWLPLPIDLHRPFTGTALSAGKSVLCEKPAAGSVQDVDAMIAARDLAKSLICAVGYQDIYQPAVQELKRRLVRGEFGVILSGSAIACWPRGQRYYQRNDWAGRISREGRWVLDSPVNNAMAHYLHLGLFLLGSGETESAVPAEVEAELYRANPIENYDTCSLRLTFDGGAHFLVGFTHACTQSVDPEVVIRTQSARICYRPQRRIEIHTKNLTEIIPLIPDRIGPILDVMHRWLNGDSAARGGTLEMARAHTITINAASEASGILDIPPDQIELVSGHEQSPLRAVAGLESALVESVHRGRMLHETGLLHWTRPAGELVLSPGWQFSGPCGIASTPSQHPAAAGR